MNRLLAVGACTAILAATVPATTFPRSTTRDMIREAERVCCAVCTSVEARRDPRTGIVFTHVRLDLLEDIKGRGEGSTIHLRLVGGRVGNRATRVAGMPRFRAGEESILLLGPVNRDGHPVVVQAARGVLKMRRDKRSRKRYLAAPVTGLQQLEGRQRVLLQHFRAAVRQELERGAEKR